VFLSYVLLNLILDYWVNTIYCHSGL
jgi:hypothetical protein